MRILLIILISSFTTYSFGQMSIGMVGEPTLNITKIGDSPQDESKSLQSLKTKDYTLGLGIEIRKQIDRFTSISFIPGYQQSNMLLVKEDLQLFDVIHPQIPEIRDLAQAAQKNAFLHYRHLYAGLQVIYAKKLKVRTSDSKLGFELGGGLGAYLLAKDDIKVRTEGFALNGNYTQIIDDSTGITARPFLANIAAVADLTYRATPSAHVFAGAKLTAPLTSTSTSSPKITIFTPALRLGLRYML